MGYKQTDNPFTKLNNSFTNPNRIKKRQVRQSEALKWNMPDLNSIVETKADGSTITEDKKTENTTGTDKEGARIYYDKSAGFNIEIDKTNYKIIKEFDIVIVL